MAKAAPVWRSELGGPSRQRTVERDRMVPIARSAAYTVDGERRLVSGSGSGRRIGSADRTRLQGQWPKIDPSRMGWESGLIAMQRLARRQRFQ